MFKSNRRIRQSQYGQFNLLGVLTIVAVLLSLLLYFTNARQQEQIYKSYCGEFGFYGKHLTLMKDGTFKFNYHGCSQSYGSLAGNWKINNDRLLIYSNSQDELLDSEYIQVTNQLIPVNLSNANFTLCEDYVDPLTEETDS